MLWAVPGRAVPTDIVLLEPGDSETGSALLEHAAELARSLGGETQGHVLDAPSQAPQFQRDPHLREQLLVANRFSVTRDDCRFLWQTGERYLADMLEMDHQPDWFEIGYDQQDQPVAISMPRVQSH